jgi:hypothetical protein
MPIQDNLKNLINALCFIAFISMFIVSNIKYIRYNEILLLPLYYTVFSEFQ